MASCIQLEWVTEPNISPCAVGEPADFRGLRFMAIFDDGSRQEVDVVLRMFHEHNLQEVGMERIGQVIYEKKRLSVKIPLKNVTLTSIQAVPSPQLQCIEGEPLDRTQVTVTAFFSDGGSRVIENYKIAPHQELSLSDTKITFRYGRCVSDMPIIVQPRQCKRLDQTNPLPNLGCSIKVPIDNQLPITPIQSPNTSTLMTKTVAAISVARKPNRQKYLMGDTMVDLKGGRLDVIYSDGSVGQIDMISDGTVYIDSKKPGTGSVSFSCLGKQVSFPIDVLEPQIVKLSIVKQPAKLDYEEGEELNLAGLVLDVAYNDGSVRTVRGLQSNGFIVGRGHADEGVTLSYEGQPFTIKIGVRKKEIPVTALSVELVHEPNKVKYIENDPHGIDLTGAELFVQMSDGRRLTIPVTSDMVDPVDLSKPGRSVLNIRYMGHTVVCSVFVDAKALRNLELSSSLKKTEYIEGEKIDTYGLIVEACYDNGSRIPVENYAVTPSSASVDDKEICISYDGATLTIPIIVHPLDVTLLDWARQPLKTVYYTHEKVFSCDGGVLRVRWNNGMTEETPLVPDMVSGFSTDRIGPHLLAITYKNKSVPLTITVKERVLLGLRIVKASRTEYVEGEEFDPRGLIVEALYTGESSEVVSVNHLPYGPLTQETTHMMLVYQDKAVVLPIAVSALNLPTPSLAERGSSPTVTLAPDPHSQSKLVNEELPSVLEDGGDGGMGAISTERELAPECGKLPQQPQNESDASRGIEEDDTSVSAKKRQWQSVPAFYPSTFCMRFSEEYAF